MSIDTPDTPETLAMGLFSPSVRGNLLDLTHIWQNADGPDSPYLPVPTYLQLVWQDSLPYWSGLTDLDKQSMLRVGSGVQQLLSRQEVRLRWLPFASYPNFYPAMPAELYPAYTLVAIPVRFRMPSPRYNHLHKEGEINNHPPVKVRWPEPGFKGLQDFLIEATVLEGVAVWGWPINRSGLGKVPSIKLEANSYLPALGVATAPWFAATAKVVSDTQAASLDGKALMAAQSPEIKHVATSIAKLDVYLFAKP